MTTRYWAAITLVCVAAIGCGGDEISAPRTAPVAGTVLVKGKPAAGVMVTFHPQFDMGSVKFTPNGQTGKDGRFILSTAAPSDGAPPGEYKVTFELLRTTADKRGLDTEVDQWKGKYADPEKSDFKVTIQKGDNALEAFRLE